MAETSARLRTEMWVKAQVRICDVQAMAAFVRRRGDAEAGSVILMIDDLAGGVRVFSAAFGLNGERGWMPAADGAMAPADAEAYIARRADIDPDIWVLEIEDPDGRYVLDGPDLSRPTADVTR
jgi:hypothetical protein